MAQYDLLLTQNVHVSGTEFSEKYVNIAKGGILSAIADGTPTVLAGGTDGHMLVRDDLEVTGLKWVAISAGHTQNTDTGTTSQTFQLQSGSNGVKLKNNTGVFEGRNAADDAYADAKFKDLVVNNLTVEGTETILNTETLTVEDKNIELGKVAVPTDTTADGGGITLKGATDKTIIWDDANDNWTLNQNVNIPTGTVYKINNTTVLSSTQVHGKTLGTMAEATATDYVDKALFDANTLLFATSDNTPVALLGTELMPKIWAAVPADKIGTGYTGTAIAGQIAKDANWVYICETGGTATNQLWTRFAKATNWAN
jgi:hypothetical protein